MKAARILMLSASLLIPALVTSGSACAEPVRGSDFTEPLHCPAVAGPVHGPALVETASSAHVLDAPEIQSHFDQKLQREDSDRAAIRELLARPDVRRVAGSAGLDLRRAETAVGVLSGPELARLAAQARDVNSRLAGGETITMTWTMVIIIVVALVVLLAIL